MIAILMATYNGAKYLEEQLKSILQQSNSDWKLFIRDDGSSDMTLNIIHYYSNLYSNKIFLVHDNQKHMGAAKSFMKLLESIEADYYMFCDQDDIWHTNKIQDILKKMREIEDKYPLKAIVVHCDLEVVDSNLNLISSSFWKYTRLDRVVNNPELFYTNNAVTGCAMMFNKICRKLSLSRSEKIFMHDAFIALQTHYSGGFVVPIPKTYIQYRQHLNNVLGATGYSNSIMKRIVNIRTSLYNNHRIYAMAHAVSGMSLLAFVYMKYKCYKIMNKK